MIETLGWALSLVLPVLVPGAVLIVALKAGWWRALRRPIDAGATLGGAPVLGSAKTWLGVVLYVVGGVIVGALVGLAPWSDPVFRAVPGVLVGLVAGAAYAAGELVNSFVKRRLGVAASAQAGRPGWARLQRVVDLVDGAVAATLAFLAIGVAPVTAVIVLVAGILLHLVAEWIQALLGLRR